MIIRRGEIYLVNFGPVTDESGSEQRGIRPALIIQNDVGNMYSPTTIVAPISLSTREHFPVHIDLSDIIGLEIGSRAMLEQIRTIDRKFIISERIATLGDQRLWLLDRAIKRSLGLLAEGGDTDGY